MSRLHEEHRLCLKARKTPKILFAKLRRNPLISLDFTVE